jgi:decaprenyl-phosphate phosphoribosyltransferase
MSSLATLRAILATLRPKQWAKNLFVVAPLVFSKNLFDPTLGLRALAAFAAFCALSGAVYAFNDVRDAELDRRHPTKRRRPVAAGTLSRSTALAVAACLAAGALVFAALLAPAFAATCAGYLALNLSYSLYLKRVAFLDVLLITGGFLLRVAGGAFAIAVPISPWLLACTALLAALLGFGKRAHELAQSSGDQEDQTRHALAGYHPTVLRVALAGLAVATSVVYALYTRDERTIAFFGTERLLLTLPFCVIGIFRFLQLALWRPRAESPTDAILRDPLFLANMLAWGAAVLAIIYWAR